MSRRNKDHGDPDVLKRFRLGESLTQAIALIENLRRESNM